MKNKLLSRALSVTVTAFFFGMLLAPAISKAQHIRPVGKTTLQSSQLVLWYDEDEDDEERDSFVQVTNASIDTPVWVHVQIFASTCLDFVDSLGIACAPGALVVCSETDFNDFYTPNDTHIYEMDNVFTNDPFGVDLGDALDNTKGFVVITPIDAPGTRNAIAHQHMFGTSFVFSDGDEIVGFGLSSMGRDAVSFSTGNVVADGTMLDGVTNGYALIQPELLLFGFSEALGVPDTEGDIISIAFRDNYEGVFGYVAEPADATWTPLIFDDEENPISCSAVVQNCFFSIGINSTIGPLEDLLNPVEDFSICPNNDFGEGWMKIAVGGLEGLENEMGILTLVGDSENQGAAVWMYAK